ncbi:phosphatidylserine decarboxylase [Campylobacter showae]|jgi:phosphatidylserine decarboxylase|uniref:phosphatidylserine decarboxylase n=1 Tax=Campylobacter showae TaxID=204 RepID=UPI0026F04D57|nr:phosphatidylserine decarboxylase [Campylobacter showae]
MQNIGLIAKQGYKYVFALGLLFLLALILGACQILFFALFVLCVFWFRNPERALGSDDAYAVLSPIDGKIKSIDKIYYFDTQCVAITIRKGVFDAGALRAPCDMELLEVRRRHGLFLCNAMEASKNLNERALFVCKNLDNKFAIRVIAGPLSKGISFENFSRLKAGRRFGFLSSGEVVLILPANARISVSVGEKVASAGILGFFSYEEKDARQSA